MVALIAAIIIAVVGLMGQKVSSTFQSAVTAMGGNSARYLITL